MRRLFTRKKIAVAAAAAALVAGGVVAYGFWTTGGTGSGTATGGVPTSNLVVTVTVPASTPLVLNGTPQAVNIVSVDNSSNAYSVDLKGDTATIDSGSIKCGSTTVDNDWFTLSSGTISDGTVYPASTLTTNASPPASGLTLKMVDDTTEDQDACQGAAITFSIHVVSETGH